MTDDRGRTARRELHHALVNYHADTLACLDSANFHGGRFGHDGSAYFRPTLRAGDAATTSIARRAASAVEAARSAAGTSSAAAHFRDVLLPLLESLIRANLTD